LRDSTNLYLASAHLDVPWDDPTLLYALVGKPDARALAWDKQSAPDLGLAFPKSRVLQGE